MTERKIAIPGEILGQGDHLLPGEGTIKKSNSIISTKYGLIDESNNLIKVIPLSGTYKPRRGNVVIGKVSDITANGWLVDIGAPENAFISVNEIPRYVNKDEMDQVMKIGDMVVGKIWSMGKRGIDLSLKSRGLGKIDSGLIMEINSNKVPRVIGKEGSMVSLIKEKTGCNITIGQNGLISLQGEKIEEEIFAKKAILFVVERSFVSGLTEEVKEWFEKQGK